MLFFLSRIQKGDLQSCNIECESLFKVGPTVYKEALDNFTLK
jgi:hypothetical protein